ncbi:hypothetical protein PRLR5107_21400 [Prevotella lacticifex]|uniref:Uncharacterized protein n=1 Tax=Prevotella lacticifex TaxID=2854755 RepID=A0A9R1C735_9BACT|nr:hypothetical protein PRLR5003_21390 [Prevotella lacticifex]GJG40518.1 hypothetical protein PRLR5019_24890 [Prevotella lacticifex]GJG44215.1 hypothetical protein PRLR5025_30010 [Prevotella lacticifex]GJG46900.1 hypothetical protein PRLR5027_24950 [Prevotella lacticifex]GJG50479.1 hypothetical protein PRLR5052_28920 [Prevotella lacticifex]
MPAIAYWVGPELGALTIHLYVRISCPFPQVNHVNNTLTTNVLHTSSVGVGFIPTLATADKNYKVSMAVGWG